MKIGSKHRVSLHVVLSKNCKYFVFAWFALGAGSHTNEENTCICETFQAPCQKTSHKKTLLSTHALKSSVNSGVLDEFCP